VTREGQTTASVDPNPERATSARPAGPPRGIMGRMTAFALPEVMGELIESFVAKHCGPNVRPPVVPSGDVRLSG
jgi:hypothetical protein